MEHPGFASASSPATDPPLARRHRIAPEAQRRGAINGARVAAQRRREMACAEDDIIWPVIFQLRSEGQSLQSIASELSRDGIVTRQGRRRWHPSQVARVIQRTLDRAAELADDLQEDLDSLRSVLQMERGERLEIV